MRTAHAEHVIPSIGSESVLLAAVPPSSALSVNGSICTIRFPLSARFPHSARFPLSAPLSGRLCAFRSIVRCADLTPRRSQCAQTCTRRHPSRAGLVASVGGAPSSEISGPRALLRRLRQALSHRRRSESSWNRFPDGLSDPVPGASVARRALQPRVQEIEHTRQFRFP